MENVRVVSERRSEMLSRVFRNVVVGTIPLTPREQKRTFAYGELR
jgi:hypothetical protein